MDQTLQQLGELLLGAVPTVILLALLYALYTTIVHKPLQRVLEERRSKTEGAVEKSRADIAAAEARTPHELLSLPFLPTSTRELMASEYGKTDPRSFSSTFVRLPGGKELWRTSYKD